MLGSFFKIGKNFFIQVLCFKFQDEDNAIQEYASLLLAEMTCEKYTCTKVTEHPILGILLNKMVSSDSDIQKNSLQVNIFNKTIFSCLCA